MRAGLRGFDHEAMTVIPGLRNRLLAQGHRFLPRPVMARITRRMLLPQPAANRDLPHDTNLGPAPGARPRLVPAAVTAEDPGAVNATLAPDMALRRPHSGTTSRATNEGNNASGSR